METNYSFSEHQMVLKQQEELVNEIETVTGKFCAMDILYSLQTADELCCALASRMEKLNVHIEEYRRIIAMMDPDYMDNIQKVFSSQENYVGLIEKDENDFLHCGNSLVPYTYCKDLIGKKVRISQITLNSIKESKLTYPTFAKHIDIIE